jgi:hypothetical protein
MKLINRREQVIKAVKMQSPDYVPLLFINKDRDQSDIIMIDVVEHFGGEKENLSEWGFKWIRRDETMGQPVDAVIEKWDDFDKLSVPDPFDKRRFSRAWPVRDMYGDRYYIASLVLTGFTLMTFIRGFENTLEDLYLGRGKIMELADAVFGFEEDVIKQLPEYGFDAVSFYDDWGTQSGLMISPTLWRDFFKPRYKKQFDLARDNGLDVYFHCCGYFYDLIPDFIDVGVNLFNISQPNLYDIEKLGRDFGGKVCFVCPVSYQTTSITGTREEIDRDVRELVDNLGCYNGGLIGYIEEYNSIGLSDQNYKYCVDAFKKFGQYKGQDQV